MTRLAILARRFGEALGRTDPFPFLALVGLLAVTTGCTVRPGAIQPVPTPTSPASATDAPTPPVESPPVALAANVTVMPRDGEGWISLVTRTCGSSKNWSAIAAGRSLIRGQAVSVNCAKTPTSSPSSAPPAAPATTWVNPLPGTCRPATGGVFGIPHDHNHDGIVDHYHQGIDLGAREHYRTGAPVVAARAGTVIWAGWNGGAGIEVKIRHAGGWISHYHHLSKLRASNGQTVTAGQRIGDMGETGLAFGPHLHVETWLNGVAKDPRQILPVRC